MAKPVQFGPGLPLPLAAVSQGTTEGNHTGSWRYLRPRYENKMAPCRTGCPAAVPVEAVMRLVEVVRAPLTSEDTSTTIYDISIKLRKEPVYCRDTFGFLANRAARGREDAIELLWAHIATPEDIDKAIRLGYNRPMGPLELSDLTGGWNIEVTGEDDAIKELGFEKGHVHPMVRMMVRAGYTGGPGKKGVYDFWREVLSKW